MISQQPSYGGPFPSNPRGMNRGSPLRNNFMGNRMNNNASLPTSSQTGFLGNIDAPIPQMPLSRMPLESSFQQQQQPGLFQSSQNSVSLPPRNIHVNPHHPGAAASVGSSLDQNWGPQRSQHQPSYGDVDHRQYSQRAYSGGNSQNMGSQIPQQALPRAASIQQVCQQAYRMCEVYAYRRILINYGLSRTFFYGKLDLVGWP